MGLHRTGVMLALALMLAFVWAPVSAVDTKPKKPSLSLRANPIVGFSPLRVVFTADLTGGPNDSEEYYCPSIQWDWGDETESLDSADCDPYVAGKSEIKRTFTAEHRYEYSGEYKVSFRLKRGDKVLIAATTTIKIRPGIRDIGD